jgi:hypothetical protein
MPILTYSEIHKQRGHFGHLAADTGTTFNPLTHDDYCMSHTTALGNAALRALHIYELLNKQLLFPNTGLTDWSFIGYAVHFVYIKTELKIFVRIAAFKDLSEP